MERYSTLWGTDKAGVYGRQGTSKRLSTFLTQKIGGTNVKDVVDATEKIMAGFKVLPGYELESLDNKPLAVVYAPMYLKNKPGMPAGIKGFCALSVNGMENRGEGWRDSKYAHTFFFAQQEMLGNGEFNHLDLLMGTYPLTARDVAGHRNGTSPLNFDQLPNKVNPVMRKQDMPLVVKTVENVYQGRNVVISLEAGVDFNRRALEVLTQIYAMMQPVLATETGFATYQTVDRILELAAETNVQIYVVPNGMDLSKLYGGKFEILDLAAERVVPEQTPLAMVLLDWMKYSWSHRRQVMAHLFGKSSDYLNAEEFVRLSKAFFAQLQDLNAWLVDSSKHNTVTTLAQLQAEDKTQTGWRLVPWARESFESKVPHLLQKPLTLDALTAEALVTAYEYDGADAHVKQLSAVENPDREGQKAAVAAYQYGRKLSGVSEAVLCQKVWEKAERRLSPGYNKEITGLNKKIADDAAAHEKAMAARDEAHKTEVTGLTTAHAAALVAKDQEKDSAVAAEKAITAAVQAKLDDADRVHGEEVAKLNAAHKTEVEQLAAAHQTVVTGLQSDIAARDQSIARLNTDLGVKDQTITGLNSSLSAKDQTIAGQKADLTKAAADYAAQGEELSKARTAAIRRKEKLTAAEAEIGRLNELLMGKGIDPTPKKPKEPTMNLLGVEMPKSAMKVIAIFAAAALLIGAILSGVIVGLVAGGKEDAEPTVPTTTAPVEPSTEPSIAPATEPSVPETTAPPETTVPPTEPPAVSALNDDGTVDWFTVRSEVLWAVNVETDAVAMEQTLAGAIAAPEGWALEAVITTLEDVETEETAFVAVLTAPVAEAAEGAENPAEEETPAEGEEVTGEQTPAAEPLAITLADLGDGVELAIAAGDRCVVAHFGYGEDAKFNDVIEAAVKVASLVSPEDAGLALFRLKLENGTELDLTELLADGWRDVTGVNNGAEAMLAMQAKLNTNAVPAYVIEGAADGVAVYDYTETPEKAEQLAGIMTEKGLTALAQDVYTLVLVDEAALIAGGEA